MNYFLLNIGYQLINLNSIVVTLLVDYFSAIFENITQNKSINKNIPAKRDKVFVWEKNVPPERDPGFMKVVSLLGGKIYFYINKFEFFESILSWQDRHFARDVFSPCKPALSF